MTRTVRGLELRFHPHTGIGRALRRHSAFEATEIDLATAFFVGNAGGAPSCILDVGANIGVHSLCWASALPATSVYAVEPAPETFALLAHNVRANHLQDRIHTIPCAVSDAEGEVDFFVAEDDAFSSLKDTRRKRITRRIRVRTRTLDALSADVLGHVGMIKIDVEGLEDAVIRGAHELLSRDRPVLFVEIYGGTNSNADPERTVSEIQRLGYEALVFDPSRGLRAFARHDDSSYNYFFLPRS